MQKINFLVGLLLVALAVTAQSDSKINPVQWNAVARKTSDKTYEVTLTATVADPWHIYSQKTPEGGPVPTTITFNKNPLLLIQGAALESGNSITRHEEVFGVDVIYFKGNASFIQTVKLKSKAKTTLSGKVRFMVCNDHECLPPSEVPFTVMID